MIQVAVMSKLTIIRRRTGPWPTTAQALRVRSQHPPHFGLLLDHAAQELKQALGLVAKLKSGRESKKRATGKGCGRKSLAELSPEAVALARKLRRYPTNGHKRSLREIAVELESAAFVTRRCTRYGGAAVARMVGA